MEMKKYFEGHLEAKEGKTDDQEIYIRKWEGRQNLQKCQTWVLEVDKLGVCRTVRIYNI